MDNTQGEIEDFVAIVTRLAAIEPWVARFSHMASPNREKVECRFCRSVELRLSKSRNHHGSCIWQDAKTLVHNLNRSISQVIT